MVWLWRFLLLFVFSLSVSAEEPRGIRNNNPGNIVKSEIQWKGEVDCADTRFECFERPEWGVRAMARILNAYYYRHGIRNVADVLHRWMPPHENETEKWIEYVGNNHCNNSSINSNDLVKRLIYIENGKMPYTDEVMNAALRDSDNVRFRCTSRTPKDMGNEAR